MGKNIFLIFILALTYLNLNPVDAQKQYLGSPFAEADKLFDSTRYDEAGAKYKKVIDFYSDTAKFTPSEQEYNKLYILTYAYFQLGECDFNQFRFQEAIFNYQNSMQNDTHLKCEEMNLHKIGLSYFNDGKYLDAINYLQKAVKKYPNSEYGPGTQYYLAYSYDLLKRPAEAIREFENFLKKYPNNQWADTVKGKLKTLKGK